MRDFRICFTNPELRRMACCTRRKINGNRTQVAGGRGRESAIGDFVRLCGAGRFSRAQIGFKSLCILKSAKAVDLSRIASVVRWWNGQLHEPAPRIFTHEELTHPPMFLPSSCWTSANPPRSFWRRPGCGHRSPDEPASRAGRARTAHCIAETS